VSHIRSLLIGLFAVTVVYGASPSIGLVVAHGSFQVDQSRVYGNATLFDGSLIETAAVSSDLVLDNGARLRLGAESRARVHPDRLVLDKGQSELGAASGYSIEALGIRTAPDSPNSRLVVTYSSPTRIQVSALTGSARVSGANGVLVAEVPAGTALEFEPQAAGATTPSKLAGLVETKDGVIVLTDEVTHVTYTLIGPDLDQFVGKRVEITGTIDAGAQTAASSVQVIHVLSIEELAKSNKRAVAGTAGAKAATAGTSSGLAGAIVVGVNVAAVGATVGLAVIPSTKPAISAP
jgi:hypothetical protein